MKAVLIFTLSLLISCSRSEKSDGTSQPISEEFWLTQLGASTMVIGGSNSSGDYCNDVTVDAQGYSYCAGSTAGALGEANGGGYDAFVMKLNPQGGIVWITQLGSITKGFAGADHSQNDFCYGVSVDSSGNVYCSGNTSGALGEANAGNQDAFVLKLNSLGAIQWITQLGAVTTGFAGGDNSEADFCSSVAVDNSGNVYCAGETSGDLGEANGGDEDAFVMKLNSSGTLQWVKQLGAVTKGYAGGNNSQSDNCGSVAVDPSGNVYCGGGTYGALGEAQSGGGDAFVMKLASNGVVQWVRQLGSLTLGYGGGSNTQFDYCNSITVDTVGNAYCAGQTGSSLGEANAGSSYDAFVMKLNSSGTLQWVTQLGAVTLGFSGGSNDQNDYCFGIDVDSSGNVYCAGQTAGDLGEPNGGNNDAFILKLSSNGALQWVRQFGLQTKGFVGGNNSASDYCSGLAITEGAIYCAGTTHGSLGESNGGSADVFIMKLNSSGLLL